MIFKKLSIENLWYIEFNQFEDGRGFFKRLFCNNEVEKNIGNRIELNQINFSHTKKRGTFRGIHYQYEKYAEWKMVICLNGEINDYAIDLRKNSKTLFQYEKILLSSKKKNALLIPPCVGHAFQTLSDDVNILYLHSSFYNSDYEGGVNYKDPQINLNLELEITEISERDCNFKFLTPNFQGLI